MDTNGDTVHEPLLASQASHDTGGGKSPEPSASLKSKLRADLVFKRVQYYTVIRKNFILKTRGSGGTGSYRGLFIEALLPVAFFALMCLPKALVKPMTTDTQLSQAFPLTSGLWSNCYVCERFGQADAILAGGCTIEPHVEPFNIAIAPDTREVRNVAQILAKTLACLLPNSALYWTELKDGIDDVFSHVLPELFNESSFRSSDLIGVRSFSERFLSASNRSSVTLEQCQGEKCYRNKDCWIMFWDRMVLYSSEEELMKQVVDTPMTIDAALIFKDSFKSTPDGNLVKDGLEFTIRMNQTDVPDVALKYPLFQISPDTTWKCGSDMYPNGAYWFFGNLESAVLTSVLSWTEQSEAPLIVDPWVASFPWPEYTVDAATAIAGIILVILLVFAYIAPFKSAVGNLVTEKELRLREGMKLFGLQTSTYFMSWFTTHFSVMFISSIMITAVGTYPFSYSSVVVLFIFYQIASIAFIAYAYTIASFFSSSKIAGTASVFIFVLTLVPGYVMPIVQPNGGRGRLLSCLLPPSAVTNWALILLQLETGKVGITWDTLRVGTTDLYPFTALQCIIMLVVDVGIYFFLAWYLDQVLPSAYGQRKPFYFIFLPETYGISLSSKCSDDSDKAPVAEEDATNSIGFSNGQNAAISIRNLCKNFSTPTGTKKAVANLNFDVEGSSITTLLGHNGAGKTTTLSIVTGMIEATSGDVLVRGKSVKRDMLEIRQDLGLCPQYDILWPQLTVYEHLRLYADLKGMTVDRPSLGRRAMTPAEVDEEIQITLRDVGLETKTHEMSSTLSGGQKRKLSVAIAFLGGPRTVFLDEPTSGMDPYSRRFTWNVIRKYKPGRCILLTTHFMDEADILSDKIAIMSQGRLGAYGTPLALKQQYGMGYTLTVLRNQNEADQDMPQNKDMTDEQFSQKIIELAKSHVPKAVTSSVIGAEVSLKLPQEDVSSFPPLLKELESNGKKEYDVGGYGLSITTIEESVDRLQVFLSLLRKSQHEEKNARDKKSNGNHGNGVAEKDTDTSEEAPLLEPQSVDNDVSKKHGGMQFAALLNKRFINCKRDKLAIIIQLLAPISLVIVALLVSKLTAQLENPKNLNLTRESTMDGHSSFYAESPSSTCDFQDDFPPSTYEKVNGVDQLFELGLDRTCIECVPELWNLVTIIEAAGSGDKIKSAVCPNHCYTDKMLESRLLEDWDDNQIQYDSLFLQSSEADHLNKQISELMIGNHSVAYYFEHQIAPLYNFSILVNQSAYHSFPVSIKESAQAIFTKQLGMEDTFNVTVRNHPYPVLSTEKRYKAAQDQGKFLLTVCVAMAVAVLSASFAVFLVKERASNSKHVQLVSGVSIIAFWSSTFVFDLLNSIVPIGGILICFAAFNLPQYLGENFVAVVLLFVGFATSSLPMTYLLQFSYKDELKAFTRLLIGYFVSAFLLSTTTLVLEALKDPSVSVKGAGAADSVLVWVFRIMPHYIICKGLSDLDTNHQKAKAGFDFDGLGPKNPLDLSVTGYHIIFLFIETILYSTLVIIVEYDWFNRMISSRHMGSMWIENDNDLDEDVLREKKAVLQSDQPAGYVSVKGLQKTYPGALVPAVKGVHFSVKPRQVFGLLGVNGAGKTTTFNMLTGHVTPSHGEASIMGNSVLTQLQAARRHLGYCPQFDATIYNMTGREHLRFYARLRGIKNTRGEREELVDSLLKKLGLTEYADRLAGTYSGGNRRKLSVGIALIGDPDVVLLDEPSTGMDPQARRSMWNVINNTVMEKKRAVILTSHSMEECEALCHRLAIMVDGQFRCIGSNQHLKNRFGTGYNLEFRCKSDEDAQKVMQYVEKELAVELAEASGKFLKYRFGHNEATKDTRLSAIFDLVESNRKRLGIEDYGISQTSLEQVFVRFASEQENVAHDAIGIQIVSP